MSGVQEEGVATPEQKAAIEAVSNLRQMLYAVKEAAETFRDTAEGKICGRELSLLITETQSARHWGGECLSHFPTGYRVTDNPNDPGSESTGTEE
tara:strand:- start:609 stop:893 length:285 start_codon:yes stop_codon:yes gene_type:complete